MKDKQHSILYPWQKEKMYPSNYAKPVAERKRYNEWPCAYPGGCTVMLNDREAKSQRRKYCDEHRMAIARERGTVRWKNWKKREDAKKNVN